MHNHPPFDGVRGLVEEVFVCLFFFKPDLRGCAYVHSTGEDALGSLFVLPSEGIHTLSYHLGFLMITVNFLRQTAVQLRVKVKSV